jgi:hypothetical protein
MKGLSVFLVVSVTSIFYLDAFLPSPRPRSRQPKPIFNRVTLRQDESLFRLDETPNNGDLGHGDIMWKVRPPPEVSRWRRLWLRFAANAIRLDCMLKREELPPVLCPKGGQAVLEAHYRSSNSSSFEKIARFGFTTERGPPGPPIQETVQEIYGLEPNIMVGVAAIIYMYVEPEYRKKTVGTLALQVISFIHATQRCDFTVLVVDDDGSGKLVDWYEKSGFSKAPKLQAMLGSQDGIHGLTMIAPTQEKIPEDCFIQWW